jgi:hypothetical protein
VTEIGDDLMTGRTDPLVALLRLLGEGVFWELELQKRSPKLYYFYKKSEFEKSEL